MVPVTTVKKEPVEDRAPHWAPIPDTSTMPGSSLDGTSPRWSSIMDAVKSSNEGAATGVPSWASVRQSPEIAPRSELADDEFLDPAPRLELTDGQSRPISQTAGQPDLITVESADGVKEQYIIKSEVASSEDEIEASPVPQLLSLIHI